VAIEEVLHEAISFDVAADDGLTGRGGEILC